MDIMCIADLLSAGMPPPKFLAVEFPADRGFDLSLELLQLLEKWGFEHFKFSRQSMFVPRCWPGRLNCEGAPSMDLRGHSTSLSGLLGDAAIDYISGPHWRQFSDWRDEVDRLLRLSRAPWYERFDVHACPGKK